ncbi:hypothetical protein KAW50_04300 [candidate division WOR-3 bacterium]|nr:hypothetical protein [candidate division WOR-3 bacterium]
MGSFIPADQATFAEWSWVFKEYVSANYAAIGLTVAEKNEIANAVITSHSSFVDKQEKENIYRGAVGKDNADRKVALQVLRKYSRFIQGRPQTTDAVREELGLPVRDKVKTPVGVPEIAPELEIDFSQRLQHKVHAGTAPQNERLNKKPKGVGSIELRKKVGETPTSPDDMQTAAIMTSSPAIIDLTGQAGKIVYYVARYLNTKGQPGPWGEVESAEVTGI